MGQREAPKAENGTSSVREKSLPQAPDKQTFPGKASSLSSPRAQPCSLHSPQLFQYNFVSLLTSKIYLGKPRWILPTAYSSAPLPSEDGDVVSRFFFYKKLKYPIMVHFDYSQRVE